MSSSRCWSASWTAVSESKLVTDALIEESGVRRSCVTLENNAARSWLVSASSCAPRTRTSRRARSIASAACLAVASRRACSVAVNAWAPVPRTARTIPKRRVCDCDGHDLLRTRFLAWLFRTGRAGGDGADLLPSSMASTSQRIRSNGSATPARNRSRTRGSCSPESSLVAAPRGRDAPGVPGPLRSSSARHQETHDERNEQEHDGGHHASSTAATRNVKRRSGRGNRQNDNPAANSPPHTAAAAARTTARR